MPPEGDGRDAGAAPRVGEVYFEFRRLGHAVRVAAIDAATGIEVAVMGPASAGQEALERAALDKLRRRLRHGRSGGHTGGAAAV